MSGGACYHCGMFNFGKPKTAGDWVVHIAPCIGTHLSGMAARMAEKNYGPTAILQNENPKRFAAGF